MWVNALLDSKLTYRTLMQRGHISMPTHCCLCVTRCSMPGSARHAASLALQGSTVPTRVTIPRLLAAPAFAPASVTPHPQLHRVPLLAQAETDLNEVLEMDEEVAYDDVLCHQFFLQARGLYGIIKYLKAAGFTAAAPSTPA